MQAVCFGKGMEGWVCRQDEMGFHAQVVLRATVQKPSKVDESKLFLCQDSAPDFKKQLIGCGHALLPYTFTLTAHIYSFLHPCIFYHSSLAAAYQPFCLAPCISHFLLGFPALCLSLSACSAPSLLTLQYPLRRA